jgi:hypothetical protein
MNADDADEEGWNERRWSGFEMMRVGTEGRQDREDFEQDK